MSKVLNTDVLLFDELSFESRHMQHHTTLRMWKGFASFFDPSDVMTGSWLLCFLFFWQTYS
jgi:hypothetical protein